MVLLWAVLILVSTFFSKISSRFGIPGLIVFLGVGMLFGSDGFNWIYFDDVQLVQQIANIALIFILFEGGFVTKQSSLHSVWKSALSLSTLGVVITAVVVGIATHLLLGMEWYFSLLLGAIISSTDAAAVMSIFRNKSIQPQVSSTLEVESASNDPMAIVLTLTIMGLITGTMHNPEEMLGYLAWQFGGGFMIGWGINKLGRWFIDGLRDDSGGFYYVLIMGISLLSYGLADLLGANGFIAAFFAGFFMGNSEFTYKRGITHFLEGLSTLSVVGLFLILGLLVFPRELPSVWKEGTLIALVLIFVARPIAVFICTIRSKFRFKEKWFISWGGIKGAVPIVLATYPAAAGMDQGRFVFDVVFFVVLISSLIQGSTLDWIAGKLGLITGYRKKPPYSLELLALQKSNTEILNLAVDEGIPISGRAIKDIALPQDTIITAIVRDQQLIAPRGPTVIKPGDVLFVLTSFESKKKVYQLFGIT